MQLSWSGSKSIAAPAERVWARLLDLKALAGGAPVVESIEELEPRHFRVTIAIGLGFFKLRAPVDVRQVDLVEPKSGVMVASGEAMGTSVHARTGFTMIPEAAGVRLDWTAEGEVTGKLAGMAGPALEETLKRLTEEFWDGFAKRAAAGS